MSKSMRTPENHPRWGRCLALVILLCATPVPAQDLPAWEPGDGDHMDVRLWPPSIIEEIEWEFVTYAGIGPKYFRLHRNGKRIALPGKAKSIASAVDPTEAAPQQVPAPEKSPLIFYGPAEL